MLPASRVVRDVHPPVGTEPFSGAVCEVALDDLQQVADSLGLGRCFVSQPLRSQSGKRDVHTYYGLHPARELMERTTWHAAQHLRQLYWFLDEMGIVPEGRLTDGDLAGLPFPKEVWS